MSVGMHAFCSCMQVQEPPQPPPANAPDKTDPGATAAAAFEVEGPSPQELLERPIQGKGKVVISSTQLKQLASLLDSPVHVKHTGEGHAYLVCLCWP